MSKPEVAHQCSMSLRCKSDTCTHAKPHTPSDCDCPACCGQWPGNADFRPRVVCIPVDQVRAQEDSGNHEKPEAPLTDHERLQAEAERLQAARAADKARIKFLEGLQSKLAPFALEIMRAANQGASFDGWEIQDTARKHGLMTHHEVSEPCGEGCACAEFEFPGECYRIDAALSQQGKEGET